MKYYTKSIKYVSTAPPLGPGLGPGPGGAVDTYFMDFVYYFIGFQANPAIYVCPLLINWFHPYKLYIY